MDHSEAYCVVFVKFTEPFQDVLEATLHHAMPLSLIGLSRINLSMRCNHVCQRMVKFDASIRVNYLTHSMTPRSGRVNQSEYAPRVCLHTCGSSLRLPKVIWISYPFCLFGFEPTYCHIHVMSCDCLLFVSRCLRICSNQCPWISLVQKQFNHDLQYSTAGSWVQVTATQA